MAHSLRQLQPEFAPAAWLILHPHPTAVALDDGAHQYLRQAAAVLVREVGF